MPAPSANPPYALVPESFRLPALARLAGRSPLGGPREVAMAVYVGARLAHDTLDEREVSASLRAERAGAARAWLASLNLPAPIRPAVQRLIDATAGEPRGAAAALRAVIAVTAPQLTAAARLDLERLATILESQTVAA